MSAQLTTFVGVENANEFFTQHYLAALFAGVEILAAELNVLRPQVP